MPRALRARRPDRLRRRSGRRISGAADVAGSSSGIDVEMDNGPAGIIALTLGGRLIQMAPQGARVKTRRVPAFERDLERVLTHQSHVPDPQLVLAQPVDARQT